MAISVLTLKIPETKIAESANSVDLDEAAVIHTVCPLVFEFSI